MTKSRKQCQSGDVCEPRSLAEAIYCMVHHSGVDVSEIAKLLCVRIGYLLDAGHPDRAEVQFQARMLAPAMTHFKNLTPLACLCREMNGVFVQFPEVSADDDDVYRGLCDAIEE